MRLTSVEIVVVPKRHIIVPKKSFSSSGSERINYVCAVRKRCAVHVNVDDMIQWALIIRLWLNAFKHLLLPPVQSWGANSGGPQIRLTSVEIWDDQGNSQPSKYPSTQYCCARSEERGFALGDTNLNCTPSCREIVTFGPRSAIFAGARLRLAPARPA